jgi:hypothetical protein
MEFFLEREWGMGVEVTASTPLAVLEAMGMSSKYHNLGCEAVKTGRQSPSFRRNGET